MPLTDGDEHDLNAMLAEITAATQMVIVCNPNNPTSTPPPLARVAEFVEAVPDHVAVVLDEAYAEYQLHDDPDASVDLWRRSSNLVVLRTFSKCYGLAGLRVGYALTSAKVRAALDAVRQPFSVNALAQAAGAEAIRHQDDVAQRVERTIVERIFVEEGVLELGLETPNSPPTSRRIDLGDADEAEVVRALGDAGVVVRPGTPCSAAPATSGVSYGTRAEPALPGRAGGRGLVPSPSSRGVILKIETTSAWCASGWTT